MAELRSECRGRHVSPAFGSLREGAVDRHELNLVPPRAKQQKQQSNKDHLEIFKRLVSGRTSHSFGNLDGECWRGTDGPRIFETPAVISVILFFLSN